MYKTILCVEGMHCGMCESFVNNVVRGCAGVKKVTSSARKGETTVLSQNPLDTEKIKAAIEGKGYRVLSFKSEEILKRGLFGSRKKTE